MSMPTNFDSVGMCLLSQAFGHKDDQISWQAYSL